MSVKLTPRSFTFQGLVLINTFILDTCRDQGWNKGGRDGRHGDDMNWTDEKLQTEQFGPEGKRQLGRPLRSWIVLN
jgi:hypothetical protein